MRIKLIFVIGCLLSFGPMKAQDPTSYKKVRVYASAEEMKKLAKLGLMPDHAIYKSGTYFETDLCDYDLNLIQNQGFKTEILHHDASAYYQSINQQKSLKAQGCAPAPLPVTPANFNLGSMGGYLTYEEMLAELDAMAAQFPQLVKARTPITGYLTWEGRPIYWMKISDNANTDENEPEVFYNSMIHAREPMALMQLIYYMWYVLENYSSNPEIKYLVDNTEMYFVPMVNPDGYVYNQTNSPNGGGLWRKNRRNNGGGNYGVDLNRNFSYQWGTSGVSFNPAADTYPGPNAFSEPETQAIKSFIEEHQFVLSYTHHTYGNLLLFPYGYDNVQTPEHDYFLKMTTFLVKQNSFANIHSVLLYPASGDTDDWLYGDVSIKPKVYAMTPETGSDVNGFWPPSDLIESTSASNLDMNLYLARLALNYAEVSDKSPQVVTALNSYIKFDITRIGIPAGNFTVSLQPISWKISSVGSPVVFNGMALGEIRQDSIAISLNSAILQGEPFKFVIKVDNGSFTYTDTLTKIFGTNTVAFNDNASGLSNWTSFTGWDTTPMEFVSPNTSITDSPFGDYPNNYTSTITMQNEVDLSSAGKAYLRFWAKWNIEAGYDYVQVQAQATGSSSWNPLCGKYTKLGGVNQAVSEPLYDGVMNNWVYEEMDLSDYAGTKLKIRFYLKSDQAVSADGFYFDDLSVEWITVDPQVSIASFTVPSEALRIFPNPSNGNFSVELSHPEDVNQLQIMDLQGRSIRQISYPKSGILAIGDLPDGLYLLEAHYLSGRKLLSKFVIHR